jgi:UDP-N-acetylmuramate-alanine ligase
MLEVADAGGYSGTQSPIVPLDVQRIVQELRVRGKKATVLRTVEEIEKYLLDNAAGTDVIVCMSNGDFGGLVQRLSRSLSDKVEK